MQNVVALETGLGHGGGVMNAITTEARYATVVVLEDQHPEKGHYLRNVSVPEAIRAAGHSGGFGATFYCYDEMKVVNTPSTAARTVRVDDKLSIVSDSV